MTLVNAVKSLRNAAARAAFLLALPETLKDLIIRGMSHQKNTLTMLTHQIHS